MARSGMARHLHLRACINRFLIGLIVGSSGELPEVHQAEITLSYASPNVFTSSPSSLGPSHRKPLSITGKSNADHKSARASGQCHRDLYATASYRLRRFTRTPHCNVVACQGRHLQPSIE